MAEISAKLEKASESTGSLSSSDDTRGEPAIKHDNSQRRLIVVLENASIEATPLINSRFESKLQLLNCDEHQSVLKRLGRDIADARPDIVHQCLLALLDSPLNKSGHLEVYIHTTQGVVIRINPECRIPRTIKRFSGLMCQLLERGSIESRSGNPFKLLEILPSPMQAHIPQNAHKIALSWNAPKVRLFKYFRDLDVDSRPLVVAVGAMAKGEDTFADSYATTKIGVSNYALSAAVACAKVCCALEDLWDIM
ncbi:Nep1-domain-containing protein [Hesseltinella vesiculosa]|uniref:Nep1-domain-containing protein n=1 Tax=Hesseltinella vesiculosa TaxID=101127 RepID=A0A1X2GL33_9FUNG|nr:Nep1-domain-containing protein [Hesseltinella vesiculosa]